mmetsp:Transcript_16932/g.40624  ORF Transcript_16932/g.40624 Transcript_16932/m.40624 type:complete len:81 (-) Transcript_16932:59-301(-)
MDRQDRPTGWTQEAAVQQQAAFDEQFFPYATCSVPRPFYQQRYSSCVVHPPCNTSAAGHHTSWPMVSHLAVPAVACWRAS